MAEQLTPEEISIIKELSGMPDLSAEEQTILNELKTMMPVDETTPGPAEIPGPPPGPEERPGPLGAMWEGYKTGASMGLEGLAVPFGGIGGLAKYVSESLRTGDVDKGLEAGNVTRQKIQDWFANLIPAETGKQEVGKVVQAGMEVPGVKPTAEFVGSIPEKTGDIAMKGAEMVGASPGTASSIGATVASAIPGALEVAGGMSTLRSVGKTAGAGMDAYRAAKQSVEEAEQLGQRVATTDVFRPKTRAGKLMERASESTIGPAQYYRSGQQARRFQMVKDLASKYGYDPTVKYLDKVYDDLSQTWKDKLGKFTKNKTEVINRLDSKGAVPMDRTIAKIDDEINLLKKQSKSGENDLLIQQLENFKTDIEGEGLPVIEAARKRLGDKLAGDPTIAHIKDQGEKVAGRIYGTLNDEMGNFIQSQGGRPDFLKWKVANKQLQKLNEHRRFKTLRRILADGDQNPEVVKNLLLSDKPSNVKILYRNLSPQGRQRARQALLHEAFKKAGGYEEFTPDKFKNALKNLKERTGVIFSGDDGKVIEGVYKALKLTEKAGEGVAAPLTGVSNLPYVTSILGGTIGYGSGMGTLAGAVALPLSLSTATRIYNSKPIRNALLKLAYMPKGSVGEIEAMKKLAAAVVLQKDSIDRMIEKQKQEEPAP